MGANLDRLMRAYGVSTPTMAAPTSVAPTQLATDATPEQQGAYASALAKYKADQEAYNKYAEEYKNRIMGTDLYSSPSMNIRMPDRQKAQWESQLRAPDYSAITIGADLNNTGTKAATGTTGQTGTTPDYAAMVNSAYGTLGRSGIGTNPGNIDQAGYDYWLNQLKSGAIAPGDFTNAFKTGANAYMTAYPNSDVTKYVQGYLGVKPTTNTNTNTTTTNPTQTAAYDTLIKSAYGGLGRTGIGTEASNIDQPGYNYWMSQLQSGAVNPATFQSTFSNAANDWMAQNPDSAVTQYVQNYNAGNNYARGGGVNRVDGGINDLVDKYELANPEDLPVIMAKADTGTVTDAAPAGSTYPVPAARVQAMDASSRAVGGPGVQQIAPTADVVEAAPQMTTPTPVAAAPAAPMSRDELYEKYFKRPAESTSLVEARKKVADNQAALLKAINDQMGKTDENAPSKAEMYFRLAAALASPTKTGGVMENVGLAAKELADFQKSTTDAKKAAAAAKLQMLLKTHEITWQTAKEELAALEKAESEEAANRRAFGTKMLETEAKNLEPKSEIGRKAVDAGFTPGTPKYQAEVSRLTKLEEEQKTQTMASQKASEERKAEEAKKLTPAEVKLKTSLDNDISTQEEALRQINIAIENSPKAFDTTLSGVAQRKFAENKNIFGGKKDSRVTATERMEAALGHSILQSAASMKGSLSDKDLNFLRGLSGLGAKSEDARMQLLKDAKDKLEREIAKSKKQHADVTAGLYREKTLTQGAE